MNLENIIEAIVRKVVREELAAVSSPQAVDGEAELQAVDGEAELQALMHQAPAPAPASPVQLPLTGIPQTPVGATPAPGPALVPTLDQIRERLMQVLEIKGEQVCVSALVDHGGHDSSGNVNVSLVPAHRYLPLYTALGSELGAS